MNQGVDGNDEDKEGTKRECESVGFPSVDSDSKRRAAFSSSSSASAEEISLFYYYYLSMRNKDGSHYFYRILLDQNQDLKKEVQPVLIIPSHDWEGFSSLAIGSKIYLVGGSLKSDSMVFDTQTDLGKSDSMVFDTQTDRWSAHIPLMHHERMFPALAAVNGKIYVIGTHQAKPFPRETFMVESYDLNDPNKGWVLSPNTIYLDRLVYGASCAFDATTNRIPTIIDFDCNFLSLYFLDPELSNSYDFWGGRIFLYLPLRKSIPPGSKFFVLVGNTLFLYSYPSLYAIQVGNLEQHEEYFIQIESTNKVSGNFEDYTASVQPNGRIFFFQRANYEFCFVWSPISDEQELNTKVHCLFFRIDSDDYQTGPWKASCHRTATYITKCGGDLLDCFEIS